MCATCGCGEDDGAVLTDLATGERRPLVVVALDDDEAHAHAHAHGLAHDHHDHDHDHASRRIRVERALLDRNRRLAEDNAAWLRARGAVAVSLMGSPGAGKTTLLERTVKALGARRPVSIVEGDQETTRDAERLRAAGARVVQIETGTVCHLDARMVRGALEALDPAPGSLVFIENVGNLVCPALFDLGESTRIVLLSMAEGDDKPLKYPHAFRASQAMVVTKLDLAPHVDFDLDACLAGARAARPDLAVLTLSARTGEGVPRWLDWLDTAARARA